MSEPAAEFVRAYYTSLVYHQGDVSKYYDQDNASIWRAELHSTESVPFPEAEALLFPEIEAGSTVTISDFNILRLPNSGFAIVVHGRIAFNYTTRAFSQYFTLFEVSERY
jgi:hypothetical protein